MSVNNITVEDFKALFTRDFPYLPYWQYGKAYFKDDIVYSDGNFYQSLTDGNTDEPPNDNWQLYNDNAENYISDNDISRAFVEARQNFNPQLFPNCESMTMAFCYIAAHYLVVDMNNAMNAFTIGNTGIVTSKHVGSVSESYAQPQWVNTYPPLAPFARTGYGMKYVELILPRLKGNIIFTKGAINFG